MKKMNVWCMMALTVLALDFTACSDSTEEEVAVDPGIVGEWKVASANVLYNEQDPVTFITDLARDAGMSEEEIEEAKMTASEENEGIDEVGGTYTFNADKTQKILYPDEDEAYGGTWSATGNVLTLFYGDDSGGADYQVRNITNKRATLVYVQQLTEEDIKALYNIELKGGLSTATLLYLEK